MTEQGDLVPKVWEQEICKVFNVKPWQVGLAPVPWRHRVWCKLTFARWRGRRALAREES